MSFGLVIWAESRARTRESLLDPQLRDGPLTGSQRSPAQTFSFLIGAVLTVAGIVGFFYNGDFSAGSHIPNDEVFGLLSVNGWLNVVHLLTGLVGLKAARTWTGARSSTPTRCSFSTRRSSCSASRTAPTTRCFR